MADDRKRTSPHGQSTRKDSRPLDRPAGRSLKNGLNMFAGGGGRGPASSSPTPESKRARTRFTESSVARSIRSRLAEEEIITEGALRSTHYVFIFFAIVAAVFFLRLVFLQVIMSGEYSAQAEESRTINFDISARRGTIYDRNGEVLATSVDATTIYCNPAEVENAGWVAQQLQEVLFPDAPARTYDEDGNEEESDKKTREEYIQDYRDLLTTPSTTFVYLKRQADVEKAAKLKEMDLPGVYYIDDTRREYPHGAIGGQVIGVCDVDGNGITGLELQYDEILRGTPGTYSGERGVKGTPIPGGVHEDTAAVDGEDIMVSLDIRMQETVEVALKNQVEHYDGEHGSSIVMDGDTGEIYAAASFPYLDPTDLANSLVGSDNLTAVTSTYEPGSIFKSVSALSVLDAGVMQPDDVLYAPAELQADQYVITDAHERLGEYYTFRDIMDKSSNIGISLATEKAGFRHFYDTITRCKILEPTGVDYPGEPASSMPSFDEWAKVTGYNISFGQGLTVTPLQMVRFYALLANDGKLVTPHFLLMKPQTSEWIDYASEKVFDNQGAIDKLNDMLHGVVTDGTGKSANIDGYCVVGKTSTAQIAENGGYSENRWNLAFTGFIDNSSSNLVCFIGVNDVVYEGNVSEGFHDIMVSAIEQYNIVPN